jgi:GAF domain-containing protein
MVDPQLFRTLKEEIADLKRDNSSLKDQNSRLWNVIQSLNQLNSKVQIFSTAEELLEMIMDILSIALEAVNSENGSILLMDDETDELVFVAVKGIRQAELTDFRIPANVGIAGWVKNNMEAALVQDVRKDNRWISAVDQSIGFHTQSIMAVPLVFEDRILGVMEIVNSLKEDHFTDDDLSLLELVARLASFVLGYTEEALDNAQNANPAENLN